jgi:hypothetical protein
MLMHMYMYTHTALDFLSFNILIFDETLLATVDILSFDIDSFDL